MEDKVLFILQLINTAAADDKELGYTRPWNALFTSKNWNSWQVLIFYNPEININKTCQTYRDM